MKILVVDVETNSTNPQRAHILEIAVARVDLGSGLIEVLVDTLVHPDCPEEEWLDCWFMQHSGLSPDDIRRAPAFSAVKEEIQRHMVLPITAFNKSFDLTILRRHGVQVASQWPCLMERCKYILRLPGYRGDWKYPNFSEAWGYFFPCEPFDEKHRAGHDVRHEARLAVALYQGGYIK